MNLLFLNSLFNWKRPLFALFLLSFASAVWSQTANSVFGFLELPVSSHANALGGNNVSLVEPDISLVFHNPALLGGETDKHLALGYMNWLGGVNIGHAVYGQTHGERGTWALGARFVDYGVFTQSGIGGEILGSFHAKDMAVQVSYSYDFTDRLRGGATFKTIYSVYEEYTSVGLGVDAGLSYFDAERDFSAGLVFKNWGAQVKAYNDIYERMPWDIQLGITKKLGHAPIRFSVTLQHLLVWDLTAVSHVGLERDSFGKTLLKHVVMGVDILPTDRFYLSMGYNPKRADDFSLADSRSFAGLSLGGGLTTGRFQIHVSWGQYQIAGSSIMAGVSYNFSKDNF